MAVTAALHARSAPRHVQNHAGARGPQVVHIDLGIAFEQGRFLTTPELVPFRLTRDIVDGMGAAGEQHVSCDSAARMVPKSNTLATFAMLKDCVIASSPQDSTVCS